MILGNRLTANKEWLIDAEAGLPAGRFIRVEILQNGLQRGSVREGGDRARLQTAARA